MTTATKAAEKTASKTAAASNSETHELTTPKTEWRPGQVMPEEMMPEEIRRNIIGPRSLAVVAKGRRRRWARV
jgi:hypothetical protein